MSSRFPDDLQPSLAGRLGRRALRLLHTPPARVLLTALGLLLLILLFMGS